MKEKRKYCQIYNQTFLISLLQNINLNIHLPENNNLSGILPNNEIATLTRIQDLDLSSNNIIGPIPNKINRLKQLTLFSLENNFITGIIPSGLFNLQSLEHISLSNNTISGKVSEKISNSISLKHLLLGENLLKGTIPTVIFTTLDSLEELNLGYNNFEGEISFELPTDFQSSLRIIEISNNQFSGTIPDEFGLLTNLGTVLDFHVTCLMKHARMCIGYSFWICVS